MWQAVVMLLNFKWQSKHVAVKANEAFSVVGAYQNGIDPMQLHDASPGLHQEGAIADFASERCDDTTPRAWGQGISRGGVGAARGLAEAHHVPAAATEYPSGGSAQAV
jgi:hypothetical protein